MQRKRKRNHRHLVGAVLQLLVSATSAKIPPSSTKRVLAGCIRD